MGFVGIAVGTVISQFLGLLTAVLLLVVKYLRTTVSLLDVDDLRGLFRGPQTRRFLVMNADLFVRSACMIAIYIGFTVLSARHGDLLLAVSSILMKLLMLFSYFTDGFAYAGEALTGRYIGEGNAPMLRQTIKWTFIWSMGIAFIFMLIYQFAGVPVLKVMTDDMAVIEASREYLPWLLLMPIVGCAAFTWDGIYIGATASKDIRNSMLWAVAAFALVWVAGILLQEHTSVFHGIRPSSSQPYASASDIAAMHILMAAYFAHLLARTIYLSLRWKTVFRGC
jgi:MATE family multidrug resistance protein